jgi:hypothetical protein
MHKSVNRSSNPFITTGDLEARPMVDREKAILSRDLRRPGHQVQFSCPAWQCGTQQKSSHLEEFCSTARGHGSLPGRKSLFMNSGPSHPQGRPVNYFLVVSRHGGRVAFVQFVVQ